MTKSDLSPPIESPALKSDRKGRGSLDPLTAARGECAYWWIKIFRKAMEVLVIMKHRAPAATNQTAGQALRDKAAGIAFEVRFEDMPHLERALAHQRKLEDEMLAGLRAMAATGDNNNSGVI
jgi:hypothetical protein